MANWVWYVFIVVTGFIIPRLIDWNQGRELLGVWDLSWSFVVYVQMLGLSVGSAVSRYVARFRSASDWGRLNTTVNTSLAMLTISAALGGVLGGVFAWFVPVMLPSASTEVVTTARWVLLLLTVNSALQLPGGVFNGVITGYERFDWLNVIRIARDGGTMIVSCAVLLAGGGIVVVAAVVLTLEVVGEVAKIAVSRRLCPQLCLTIHSIRLPQAKELLAFGGKTAMQSIAQGGIYQGSSLLVAGFLGPAALAVYSRQRALVMHAMHFVKQYAQVFIPRSSSLDARSDFASLRAMLIRASRYGFFICLPIMLLLLILGDTLVEVWMGASYRSPIVLTTMVVGHLVFVPQMAAYSILMGMGRHGVPALQDIGAAAVSIVAGLIVLGSGGGLVGAALAMTLPLTVSAGLLMPWYACRCLKLPYGRYLAAVVPGPLLSVIPAAGCLLVARVVLNGPVLTLGLGVTTAGAVTLAIYWRFVLPLAFKEAIVRRISWRFRLTPARTEAVGPSD
jgi:O-antigen/teichoic acid export membrane protein